MSEEDIDSEWEEEIDAIQAMYPEEVTVDEELNVITCVLKDKMHRIQCEFTKPNNSDINIKVLNHKDCHAEHSDIYLSKLHAKLTETLEENIDAMPILQCISYLNESYVYNAWWEQEQKAQKEKLKQHKIAQQNEMYPCTKCNQSSPKHALFSWSKCRHLYCKTCAATIINQALSNHNSIPKCIHRKCKKELNIQDGHKIMSLLSPKFQINKSVMEYIHESALMDGYWRTHMIEGYSTLRFPETIKQLISDYFGLLTILTKIKCYSCDGTIAKTEKCPCYKLSKPVTQWIWGCDSDDDDDDHANYHWLYRKYSRADENCKRCKGFGVISPCSCKGLLFLMVLDFKKFCKRQIILN